MIKIVSSLFIVLAFSSGRLFATGQIPDRLIYKGDTLSIFANPIELLYDGKSERPQLLKGGCQTTACWRGYQAEWIIIEGTLYLTGIYSCCYSDDRIKADLNALFHGKVVNGRVKADWFTGKITAPKGKLLFYIHSGYESLYETELELEIKHGKLLGTRVYDNSGSRQSRYSQDSQKLIEYIYSNIHWYSIPNIKSMERVFVKFSANETGRIDSAKVMRSSNDLFNLEAIRVIKSIPEWDVYIRHGKLERIPYVLPIVFSEENRRKYGL